MKMIHLASVSVGLLLALSGCTNSDFASGTSATTNRSGAGSGSGDSMPVPLTVDTADGTATATPTATATATPAGSLSGDGGALATPTPASGALGEDGGTIVQKITSSNLWFAADDGTKIAFDLTTGLWGELDVFNPNYDHNVCQDYVGFVSTGAMNITAADGSIVTFPINTGWRMNPKCAQYSNPGKTWAPVAGLANPRQMPGKWGNLALKSAKVTLLNSDNGNSVTVTQVGNLVVFQGYHSSVFSLEMELEIKK